MRKLSVVFPVTTVALIMISATAAAQAVDRGLPTANLNNAAGSNRSNVAWSNGNDNITGDTFVVGLPGQTWVVTAIRTWNIGHIGEEFESEFSDVVLYFGDLAIAPVPGAAVSHTKVSYSDLSNYQGSSGTDRQIWQNDFTNLGLVVNGGQSYYFAVDGAALNYYWFNHASNAARSGSPQQGSDDKYVSWAKTDLVTAHACDSNGPIDPVSFCNGGWDKSSDINVQIFATQVATDKDACKKGGWQTLARADLSSFKNQGDCIQYVNTGK